MGSIRSPTSLLRVVAAGGTFRGRRLRSRLRSRLHSRFWSFVSRRLPYRCQLVVVAGCHRLLCDSTRVADPLLWGLRGRLWWRCTHRLHWHRSDRTHQGLALTTGRSGQVEVALVSSGLPTAATLSATIADAVLLRL